MQSFDMKKPVSYETPQIIIVEIIPEGAILALSSPDFNPPFTDGGEDW